MKHKRVGGEPHRTEDDRHIKKICPNLIRLNHGLNFILTSSGIMNGLFVTANLDEESKREKRFSEDIINHKYSKANFAYKKLRLTLLQKRWRVDQRGMRLFPESAIKKIRTRTQTPICVSTSPTYKAMVSSPLHILNEHIRSTNEPERAI